MKITWPDPHLPPINLWNVPWQKISRAKIDSEKPRMNKCGMADKRSTLLRLLRNR